MPKRASPSRNGKPKAKTSRIVEKGAPTSMPHIPDICSCQVQFSANTKQHSRKFIVVVPKGSEDAATQRASELEVELDDLWAVG